MLRTHSMCGLWLAGLLVCACSDGPTDLGTGSIEVASTTTGDLPDPNGYTLTIDGGETRALGANARLTMSDLASGEHEVELSGLAPNCTVAGDNPRRVTVTGGGTSRVAFEIDCSTPSGSIEVATSTSGEDLDPDGYLAVLDSASGQQVAINGSVVFTGVAEGNHTVHLDGLAPNCAVSGEDQLPVAVGSNRSRVEFTIACRAPSGSILVSATTAGPLPDPDGYGIKVDDSPEQQLTSSGSILISDISVGAHQVQLTGVADNCTVDGTNPQTVTVVKGITLPVMFRVNCHATGSGTILFSSDRSGEGHIYRVKPDGSDLVDLTPRAEGWGGDWSPDGSQVVFGSSRDGEAAVYVMNADGTHVRRLGPGGAPSWSPDGRSIVFVGQDGITVMDADGGNRRLVGEGYEPSWSPDGTRIAFSRVDRSRCLADLFCPREIWVMAPDGSQAQRLTVSLNPSDQSGGPAWSPDGASIAYTRHCCFLGADVSGLWVMSSRGGGATRIESGAALGRPVWSPDGTMIVYAQSVSGGPTELVVISSRGGPGAVLASSPGSEYPSSWK